MKTHVTATPLASTYGVLRGLHYQDMRAPMAKLVRCTAGNRSWSCVERS
jgi:dTDP-4-dehydrorhamnose 3,5-epimerase-like enzyme